MEKTFKYILVGFKIMIVLLVLSIILFIPMLVLNLLGSISPLFGMAAMALTILIELYVLGWTFLKYRKSIFG